MTGTAVEIVPRGLLEVPAEAANADFMAFMALPAGDTLSMYVPGGGYSAWGDALIRAGHLKADTELLLRGTVRRVEVKAELALWDHSDDFWRITLTLLAQ